MVKLSNAIESVIFKVNGKTQANPDSRLLGLSYNGAGAAHPYEDDISEIPREGQYIKELEMKIELSAP
ncbi:hypothetical protein G9U52_11795 [Paenibacillus sp. S3N08]|uniref:Uncharacterized protein n=2 Tax=Paenibacillus agricola TaxID=2716264 RepID=A0ABX0J2H4_9BACL|nr:hypothetical protein [Paenibacillus agricola]